MKSRIFYSDAYKKIQLQIISKLNAHEDFLSESTAKSPRAVGDAIESILREEFEAILGEWCVEYTQDFPRRAMADLAFKDKDGFNYYVDVSTYRTDTDFNMPNVTSVERLARFYGNEMNYFIVLSVSYHISGTKVIVSDVHFAPIEFFKWDCLTIGALGWGQIQIANSKKINIEPYSRSKWHCSFWRR